MQIIVTRAFLLRGERQEVGSTLDLPDPLARELAAMGKVAAAPVAVTDDAPEAAPAAPAPAKPKSRTKA